MSVSTVPLIFTTTSFFTTWTCTIDTIPLFNHNFFKKPFCYMVFTLFISQLLFFISEIYLLELSDKIIYSRIHAMADFFYAIAEIFLCLSILERNAVFVMDDGILRVIAVTMSSIFVIEVIVTIGNAIVIIVTGNIDAIDAALINPAFNGPLATISDSAIGIRTLLVTLNELYYILSLKKMGYLTKNSPTKYIARYYRMVLSFLFGVFLIVSIFLSPQSFDPQNQDSIKYLTQALEVYVIIDVFMFEFEAKKRETLAKGRSGTSTSISGEQVEINLV